MKRIAILVAILGLAACGREDAHADPRPAMSETPASNCALTISFGSYAMGIDRGALAAVEKLLANDAAVENVERRPWGREGEVTLCVQTRTPADAKRLAHAMTPLFPAKPRGPITVTAGGLKVTAPRE